MDIDEQYQKSLDYLYSYIDYSLTRSFRYSPEKFDLNRMKELLHRLGNPHNKYKVIHIAGTKGKGSTAAFIESILRMAGYKTGLYTSPHMNEFVERIQVNREFISKEQLVYLVEKIKHFAEEIERITTFELTTALGFLYFAEMNVDVAIVEVGMGGRLDATNLVTPLVSIITQISYDHTSILGNTLNSIAREKGGIIKEEIPTIIAPQKELALKELVNIAEERKSKISLVGENYRYSIVDHNLEKQNICLWNANEQELMNTYIENGRMEKKVENAWRPLQIEISLLGYHQAINAATAYAAIQVCRNCGIKVSNEDIINGFRNTFWPGRFELISKSPLIIIDSAHNPESALMLRLAIEDYLGDMQVTLLFGASEDKDVYGMLEYLITRIDEIVISESTHPRVMKTENILNIVQKFGIKANCFEEIKDAYKYIYKKASDNHAIVVAGSIFMAAAIRELWDKHNIKRTND